MNFISTDIINAIINKINTEKKLKRCETIFYQSIVGTLNKKHPYVYSQDEMIEWSKCYKDPIYFIENYCKMVGNTIKLRDYQKSIIYNYQNYKFNIFLNSREIGFSNIACCLILWETIFNQKNISLVYNKLITGVEYIENIKQIYLNLPYFLKPRINNWNKSEISFINSKIKIDKKMSSSDIIYIDDAFNISLDEQINMINDFDMLYKDSKLIITGCPSWGPLYNLSQSNSNFTTLRTYWWQVPGRDEKWMEDTIKKLGSEDLFNKEYNLCFKRN